MKLKEMKKEELEALSYGDLTELILKENKKAMNTPSIFKKICNLLELSEEEYTNQIGEYYTSLTTDKRFIMLEDGKWDLKTKHSTKVVIDSDEEEEEDIEEVEDELEEELEEEEDIFNDNEDEIDDDDDDLKDLVIIDEDEEANG